ncbi:MAG: 50S ribosomal protein L5 [Saprospiraceae bacterium]|jgi:large subunit ribosomal protein L5|nr:50S ribosomal protein L5 [Saprospiraceae bacterium]MBK6480596.1 50S ribosomal protein L5 [Saprospiraceae bacterium]MBK6817043.1 50S ribosomal protein L5 [Saprospiraceae bacterium]MBK7371573.1 50S ribosomal protein L5 [Saprospiraceae bacterium]MBK7435929.1 50S ribosomal protein L5 [Saprospiraceae bacterium]
MKYTPRLKKYYLDTIVPKLTEQFKYTTVMQVPKVLKVCINQGVGEATQDRKSVDIACAEISLITGQKAVPTKSKKAISNFKLREDMAIGARVTLRGDRMYEFLDRLIAVALPRVRDFRGINDKSFDGRGNFTLGVTEQIIFPEIDLDKISKISGMDISIITSARTDKEAHALLSSLGLPFKNQKI